MRRSKKETVLLEPVNRLLHNDIHEAEGQLDAALAIEAAHEWLTGEEAPKPAKRKPGRL